MSSNSFDYTYLNWDSDFFGVSSGRIVLKEEISYKKCDIEILLSLKEQKLYSLLQLCSTNISDRKSTRLNSSHT